MTNQGTKIAIQVLLTIVIVALGYWLYLSITGPWKAIEMERAITENTRTQLTLVRTALVRHDRVEDRFPGTIDSLMLWVMQDSVTMANPDSVFGAEGINLDSLIYSPRTGRKFEYSLNDTGRVAVYLLMDPDSDDRIGSATPEVSQLNAASWE